MNTMKRIVAKYPNPLELINSIYIGNEVLFREDKTRDELIEYIQDAKTFLQSKGIDDIPVGTSEIGSLVDLPLCKFVILLVPTFILFSLEFQWNLQPFGL